MANLLNTIIKNKLLNFVIYIILISTSIFDFFPSIINTLGLTRFVIDNKQVISILWIVTLSWTALIFIGFLWGIIISYIINDEKIAINYLKNHISYEEKNFIMSNFFDMERKEFKLSCVAKYSNGTLAPLENKKIIYRPSNMAVYFDFFNYNLQPYVISYLNKKIEKKEIIISDEGYKWIKC